MEPRSHHVQCLSPAGFHRMAYVEWGDDDNPRVLVCAHGLTRMGRDFDRLARAMADRYRVVCPDVVGRGHSDWLRDPAYYAIPQYASDMVALIARLERRAGRLGRYLDGRADRHRARRPGGIADPATRAQRRWTAPRAAGDRAHRQLRRAAGVLREHGRGHRLPVSDRCAVRAPNPRRLARTGRADAAPGRRALCRSATTRRSRCRSGQRPRRLPRPAKRRRGRSTTASRRARC